MTLAEGSPPYTAYFQPRHPLSAVNGEPASGNWKLIVKDTHESRHGRLLCGFLDLYYGL
jgi:subtilisin-like proprotein convertase family protein